MSEEKQLKDLRRSRSGHRAYATKVVNEQKALLLVTGVADDVAAKNKTDILTNVELLKGKLPELRELDAKIADLILDDDAYGKELIDAGEYNRSLTRSMVATAQYLEAAEDRKPIVTTRASEDSPSSVSSKIKLGKLPRINVPTFDGDPLKFNSHSHSSSHSNVSFTTRRGSTI